MRRTVPLADHLHKSNAKIDKVELAMKSMTPDDREVLLNALADSSFGHADIGRALRAEGHGISDSQVRYYRSKMREAE